MLLEGLVDASSVKAVNVVGVNSDSRKIKAGEAFFALSGVKTHGDAFCDQAIKNGAVVIVSDRDVVPAPDVAVIIVDDVRKAYAQAAAKTCQPQPQNLVGITGTSGKTSVVSFVQQIWEKSGIKGASIGTLGISYGGEIIGGELTTPDALSLHKSMALLKKGGCNHVALEASSHGLDQRRLDGIKFNIVGFTNLSQDHLDYHADKDEYREAKLRLFRDLLADGGYAVVNSDDEEHMPFMFAALDRGATLLSVGEEGAYFEITDVQPEGFSQRVVGKLVGEPANFLLPLVGRFQVDNAVMAASLAIQSGADDKKTIEALNHLKGAKGRLENVGEKNGAAIFVDYAHKPDALEKALEALRPFVKGKLIVVFGAGGDRDKGKRPIMGEIASRLADKVIICDDNPRTEDASAIRKDILQSAKGAIEIADRKSAILQAIAELKSGDVLLIAGKGHEEYQIIGTEKFDFSDHDVVRGALEG
jgi:UDP-N-acetylmuramoyl-L-alanyl-D-glutamate--2,6-diaminopimelate ligase